MYTTRYALARDIGQSIERREFRRVFEPYLIIRLSKFATNAFVNKTQQMPTTKGTLFGAYNAIVMESKRLCKATS
jgi:hypothetical protein